jgi:ferredoxin-type protein NapH
MRHLNKLRWLCLTLIFLGLVVLPFLAVYQSYVAAHAYDLLPPAEKRLYDLAAAATAPFTKDPARGLDVIKGNTWSMNLWGLKISDPLAVVGAVAAQIPASGGIYWPFLGTALLPLGATMLLGRIYCGWICPATFLYELNSNLGFLLARAGLPVARRRFDRRFKYLVLALGLAASATAGATLFAAIYPPALLGRELFYSITLGGSGGGAVFFAVTLLLDLLVARRGFCRYLCPGGALYSLLGRYRLLRIRREVTHCNDCARCDATCEFGLAPMRDGFGQECNNCTACIAACPTDALRFTLRLRDGAYQGPGHLGRHHPQPGPAAAP